MIMSERMKVGNQEPSSTRKYSATIVFMRVLNLLNDLEIF
jgi:hypothetical protein